ncbi:MAG TPA: hypothetical protein VFZ65_18830 [Planctomycetota bacterium]|nr:hypothetical protein [Planctomycetota bacterium]
MLALLGAAAAAQAPATARLHEPERVTVLAHGAGEPMADRWALARSDAECRNMLASWRVAIEPPKVDYSASTLVLVSHGRGRGGEPAVSLWSWGDDASTQLVRLAGDRAAPVLQGRWAVLLLPASFQPWRGNIRFETDVADGKVGEVWRSVCTPCQLRWLGKFSSARAPDAVARCFQDQVSWQAFWHLDADPAKPPPECDFATHVLVVTPIRRQSGTGLLRGPFRTALRVVEPAPDEPPHDALVFAVPRRTGELVVETTPADDATRHRIVARFVVADPSSAVVLRRFECDVEPREQTVCERAATQMQWQALRRKVGGAVAALTNDWCDFSLDTVVVVVAAAAAVRPDFGIAVGEEEGVDVLTLTQELASDAEARSFAAVLKVPRRKPQLAVVLRRAGPPEAESEATLQVFPGH